MFLFLSANIDRRSKIVAFCQNYVDMLFCNYSLESPYGLPQRDGPCLYGQRTFTIIGALCLTKPVWQNSAPPCFASPKKKSQILPPSKKFPQAAISKIVFVEVLCKFLIHSNVFYSVALDIVPSWNTKLQKRFQKVLKRTLKKDYIFWMEKEVTFCLYV